MKSLSWGLLSGWPVGEEGRRARVYGGVGEGGPNQTPPAHPPFSFYLAARRGGGSEKARLVRQVGTGAGKGESKQIPTRGGGGKGARASVPGEPRRGKRRSQARSGTGWGEGGGGR